MIRKLLLAAVTASSLVGLASSNAIATPEPPSDCALVPETFVEGDVGQLNTWFFLTTGCHTSKSPVKLKVVDGDIPDGTTLFTQGVSSGGITGVPTTEGLFVFTIQVRDSTGTKDTETYSIQINPPRPLVVTTAALNNGNVGEFYCCGNLFAAGGVLPYTWSLVEGSLPPGLELAASPGRITGTPTEAGSFTFTVRVTDEAGATADATFTIVIT